VESDLDSGLAQQLTPATSTVTTSITATSCCDLVVCDMKMRDSDRDL